MVMAHSVLATSCMLKSCTFAAAARHSDSKTSGKTLLDLAMAHSVLATSCALKPCTFAVAAEALRAEDREHDGDVLREEHLATFAIAALAQRVADLEHDGDTLRV